MSIPALPSFDDVIETEGDIRRRNLRLYEKSPCKDLPDAIDVADLVQRNAVFLELVLAGALLYELAAELGVDSIRQVPRAMALRRVKEFSGIDASELVRDARKLLTIEPRDRHENVSIEMLLPTIHSVVEGCPIESLETLGASHAPAQMWAHKARLAYEGLKSFCFRADPKCKEVLRIVGRQYVAGNLSIDEASKLLGLDSVDAVALLQQGGYARPLDRIELTEDARADIYRRIREARLSSSRTYTAEDVARDVIASERIEGIDARRWIER